MELIAALGLDSTLFMQIGIFLVTFVFLKYVLFDPYFAAYLERAKRTVGQVDEAEELIAQTRVLEQKYSDEARKINQEYKAIYDKTRMEAVQTFEQKVSQARMEAKEEIESTREKVAQAADSAKNEVKKELPQMSELISSRLLGKELH